MDQLVKERSPRCPVMEKSPALKENASAGQIGAPGLGGSKRRAIGSTAPESNCSGRKKSPAGVQEGVLTAGQGSDALALGGRLGAPTIQHGRLFPSNERPPSRSSFPSRCRPSPHAAEWQEPASLTAFAVVVATASRPVCQRNRRKAEVPESTEVAPKSPLRSAALTEFLIAGEPRQRGLGFSSRGQDGKRQADELYKVGGAGGR